MKLPADRAKAVKRMKEIEDKNLEKAKQIANRRGMPFREDLPNGRSRVLVGVDDDGELLYYEDRNANAAISTAANKLHTSPYSINGSGVRVGVWENSSPRSTHREFNDGPTSRINLVQPTTFGDHATHVAGTIGAFGVTANAKGMAYQTIVDAYTTGSDTSEMTAAAATGPGQQATKLHVSNHSYGYTYGWKSVSGVMTWSGTGTDQNAYDPDFGKYSTTSRTFDSVHYNSPYYLAFWAAGNENTDGPANGGSCSIGGVTVNYNSAIHPKNDGQYSGGFDTLGDHTTAKNVMVIGAANDAVTSGQRDPAKATIAIFSSTGPCDDGRIKPDVVGNGVSLNSPYGSTDIIYANSSGTSMSTPNVCGTAALLVDLYRSLNSGGAMRASTLRGLLIHTATDIGRPGPDYTFGWGLVDAEKAAQLIKRQADYPNLKSIVEDQLTPAQPTKTVTFSWDGISPIRATLAWTDPAGVADAAHNERTPDLVNDLNLKLIAPDGTEYFPFVMPFVGTWTVASMSQNASTGVNFTDNVEQVLIANPGQAGVWQVVISHAGNLTNNLQDYGLLVSGSFDPAGTLSFSSDSYSVNEDAGTVTVTVERIGGAEGAVSVNYATSNGTATAGSDYTATSGSLSWNNNDSVAKTFTIPITNDSIHGNAQKTVTITLSNPSGIGISGTNPVTLTINDDDNQLPTVDAGAAQTVSLSGSEWSPGSLSPALWLDASDSATITLNGSTVSQWSDKSGNNRHATQATSGSQPTLTSGALNSRNVLTFDGSSDFLNVDLDFMAGVDHSVFVVTKPTTYNNIYGAANSGAGSNSLHVGFQNNTKYRMNYWNNDWYGTITSNFQAGAANLLNYVWLSGTTKEIFANGQSEGTNNSAGIVGTMSGGGRISNVTGHGYYGGDIAEFIAFGKSLTSTERQELEGFLAHKWGTTSLLASGHPYKNQSPDSLSATATLGGTASDGDSDPLTITWSLFSGPAAVTFGDASVLNTTATFTAVGVYTLRLTANDGRGQTTDDIIITVATPGLDLVVETPSISENGGTSNATLTRLSNVGDLVVTLSSDDTSEATVPPSVTIPDGQTTANFTITAINDAIADGTKLVTITAVSSGNPDAISTIEITDDEVSILTLNVVATSVNESAGPGATTATVTRNSETTDELVVNLSSNDTSEANLPASITIAAGQSTSPAFDIDAINDAIVDGSQTVAFTASASGHVSGTDTLEVTDDIPFTLTLDMGTGGSSTLGGGLKDPDGSPYSISATADAGYAFVNWALTSGAATLGDENAALTTVTASANVTLQANFALITYTVSYHGNGSTGGTIPVDAFSPYNSAATVTVLGNTGSLTQSGFTFAGWNTASDGSGTSYAAGNTFTINENTTLFAVWTPIPPTLSITHIGTQFNLETKNNDATVGWRNTTPVKTLDVDGDNIVGTDGYRTSNRGLNPSYLTATVVAPNTNNFSNIDDPNNPSGADVSTGTLHDSNAGLGVETVPLLQFVMTGAVPLGETLRVGILIDGVTSALGTNSATYTLRQTVGGSAAVTSPALNWQDGGLDVTYFDLTGLSDGDTFVVTARNSATNTEYSSAFEQVIGITFDTGVITPPGETFTDWISGFSGLGGLTAFGDDPDGDGIKNGIENYFGTHPGESSQGIVSGTVSGNTFTFSHPLNEAPASNVTAGYRWSKDLSGFHADGELSEGTTVTFSQSAAVDGIVTVTATVTGTALDRLFVDVEVVSE